MAIWILEPGHTAIEFRARHMMVTWVRGHFKDVQGRLDFDWDHCLAATFEGETDTAKLWTGQPERDAHLRSADFFDVDNHPTLSFAGRFTGHTRVNRHDFGVSWQDQLPGGGLLVSDMVVLTLDAEAILEEDLENTGAIEYYRS